MTIADVQGTVDQINAAIEKQKSVKAAAAVWCEELRKAEVAGATEEQLAAIIRGVFGDQAHLDRFLVGTPLETTILKSKKLVGDRENLAARVERERLAAERGEVGPDHGVPAAAVAAKADRERNVHPR